MNLFAVVGAENLIACPLAVDEDEDEENPIVNLFVVVGAENLIVSPLAVGEDEEDLIVYYFGV